MNKLKIFMLFTSTKPSALLDRKILFLLTEITSKPTTNPIQGFQTHNIAICEMRKKQNCTLSFIFVFCRLFKSLSTPFVGLKVRLESFLKFNRCRYASRSKNLKVTTNNHEKSLTEWKTTLVAYQLSDTY